MSESLANDRAQAVAAEGRRPPEAAWRRIGQVADGRVLSMLAVFVLLCLFFHIASHGIFFQPRNLSLLLRQASIVVIVSAGVSILMVMGEIDLSIGSAVFLCSVVAAGLQLWLGLGTVPTVLLTILAGLVLGALQGILVVRVSVPSFIVTLAGLLAFRGIGYYATDASTIAPVSNAFSNLSEGFIPRPASYVALAVILVLSVIYLVRQQRRSAGQGGAIDRLKLGAQLVSIVAVVALLAWIFGGFLGIPMALVWVAGTGLVLWILMTRSKFGRNAYMIGANREAAVLAGIALGGSSSPASSSWARSTGWPASSSRHASAPRRPAPAPTWSSTRSRAPSSAARRCAAVSARSREPWSAPSCSRPSTTA